MELLETVKFEPVSSSEETVPEERIPRGDGESVPWGECPMGENLPSDLGLLPSTSNPLNQLNPDSLRVAALHSSLY